MAKIKHLIFDMGNVLMRYDPEVPLKKFVKTEKVRNLIRRELFEDRSGRSRPWDDLGRSNV